jgi:4-diphosphocytidyl-2-C-methyl-D-erythritol kinase
VIVFPNCKINLVLHILGKRDDGFHNLETVFYPVPFKDALELIPNTTLEFTTTGLAVDGKAEDNLCVKAYHLLKKDLPQLPAVKMHLHKAIPMGAGLGGGSADAAFMLKLLNERFQLNLSTDQLISYALELGSDAPFFIINKPCLAGGRGEVLEETAIDLSMYKMVLINPGIHINTGWAFAKWSDGSKPSDRLEPSDRYNLKDIIQRPVETWKDNLKNDFEEPVFDAHPGIKEIKDALYQQGAIYAAMSGSGSTVFGISDNNIDLSPFKDRNYFIKTIN